MALNNMLSLITGSFWIILGIAFIVFRRPISEFYRRVFGAIGSTLADRTARSSRPGTTLFVGVGSIALGVCLVLMGIFRHSW